MANFTRLDILTVNDSLRVFSKHHDIYMGIDESDTRPNIINYVFFHQSSLRGCVIMVDFEQVEELDKTIDIYLNSLRKMFDLED